MMFRIQSPYDFSAGFFNVSSKYSNTNARVKGEEVAALGIASHFVLSRDIERLQHNLSGLRLDDSLGLVAMAPDDVSNNVTDEFLDTTEYVFGVSSENDTVEGIFDRLENLKTEWAQQTLEKLQTMSPLSLKVTLKQLRQGATKSMKECLQMEYRIACHMMANADFVEGVRSVLIDKDNAPKWRHKDITQVPNELVQSFFEPIPDQQDLTLFEK